MGVQELSASRPFSVVRAEVEARLAWVEKRMLMGEPPSVIDRNGMRKFGLRCTRTMRRYRAAVERRWPPLTDQVARDRYRARLLARVEYGVNRCVKNEAIARRGGDINAANGAVRTMALVMGVGAKVAGVEAARQVEVTKMTNAVSSMSPEERQARARRHAERLVKAPTLADRTPEGNA